MTDKNENGFLHRLRHSAAHVMAEAVLEKFPEGQIAIGPPIQDGFYYDFDLSRSLTPEDLAEIEARMREIIAEDRPFVYREVSEEEARELFAGQVYKQELIDGLVAGGEDEYGEKVEGSIKLSVYLDGDFVDLCRGPHVERTGQINPAALKLLNVAGAYWRGDENRPMLQRIYGTAWETAEELEEYLWRLEEAKRRDHRRLGRELELFASHELIGAGLPLLLPKGAVVRRQLEEYILEEERRAGYSHVYTPDLAKRELYEVSGHWGHFQEDMFPPIRLEHEEMVLRPMNCPHHILVYASRLQSYRDLPLRIAELGKMYRYERSGVTSGLSRVRAMTLNDAHIFCTPEQVKEEFSGVMRLVERAYAALGITEYSYRLSLRDTADRTKYADNDAMWEMAEAVLREAMADLNLPYAEAPGEAAFYGPKLDIQFRDVLGHEETISTVQVDFHLPQQFDLTYAGEDGQAHRPVIIHRAIISTMERMMAYLIELYDGAFPAWLAPVQVVLIPIADRHVSFARQVASGLFGQGFRVEVDDSSKRMGAKIREAQLQKVPYMLVVGDREVEAGAVAVRLRSGEDLGAMSVEDFDALLGRVVDARSLDLKDQAVLNSDQPS
jgi:threonyl-tRNA synthetase